MASVATRLIDLPQDIAALVCQYLHPEEAIRLLTGSRGAQSITQQPEIWQYFCSARWGAGANLHLYDQAKDCYRDRNGWFPWHGMGRSSPRFQVRHLKTHQKARATMDMRATAKELVTVSDAIRPKHSRLKILDPATAATKADLEVSQSTLNCCDIARGLVCVGSDDGQVRAYGKVQHGSENSGYALLHEFSCQDKVNDLRITDEGKVIALKTRRNRIPSGLDIIDLEHSSVTFVAGGSRVSRGKFLHALDGFDGGCSLNQVTCVGEHSLTTSFSAMLFDFRRSDPCVLDVPVTEEGPAQLLWPLRAGRFPQVFAGLVPNTEAGGGLISMVDFRYAADLVPAMHCHLPYKVDDFRYLDGSIYAICSDPSAKPSPLKLHRFSPEAGRAEYLCTVVESCITRRRRANGDLKVLGLHAGGFAVAFGDELALGTIAQPQDWMA